MNNQVTVFAEKRSAAVARQRVTSMVVSQCLHKALDDPYRSWEALRTNFFIELFGLVNALLASVANIRRIGIEDTATPELALAGGGGPPFEPVPYRSLRHADPLGNRCLGQTLVRVS